MLLQNKRILVTGATSGIGKEISRLCIENGAEVIFCGRSIEKIHRLKSEFGDRHSYVQSDLSTDEGISRLVDICYDLDGVVHSAGMMRVMPIQFVTRDTLNEIMNINFYASTLINASLLKKKAIVKGGSIVFISSIGGNFVATKGNSLYGSTKGAINAYAKVMALELAGKNIRVNTVNPGMVKGTNLWENDNSQFSSAQIEEDKKRYPLGYGEPNAVAGACVFLLSSYSTWITGENLVIDGGFSIQ